MHLSTLLGLFIYRNDKLFCFPFLNKWNPNPFKHLKHKQGIPFGRILPVISYRPTEFECFLKLSADKLLVFKWSQAQVQFFKRIGNRKLRLWAALLKFWFQADLRRENSASFTGREFAFDLSHHRHALVTLYVQFLFSDWSKFDRWVHAENLCSILKRVYALVNCIPDPQTPVDSGDFTKQ